MKNNCVSLIKEFRIQKEAMQRQKKQLRCMYLQSQHTARPNSRKVYVFCITGWDECGLVIVQACSIDATFEPKYYRDWRHFVDGFHNFHGIRCTQLFKDLSSSLAKYDIHVCLGCVR